jgi:Uncharacterised protein family (UPF0182)
VASHLIVRHQRVAVRFGSKARYDACRRVILIGSFPRADSRNNRNVLELLRVHEGPSSATTLSEFGRCPVVSGSPPDYGKLIVYEFPKEKLVYGPFQIEALINQNTEISQQLSLWNLMGLTGHPRESADDPNREFDFVCLAALSPGGDGTTAGAEAGDCGLWRQGVMHETRRRTGSGERSRVGCGIR